MNWYGGSKQTRCAGPTLPMEDGFSPKPRARTSSVPVDHPQQSTAPPISPRGSSVDQQGPATAAPPSSPPPAAPSPVPMTMTLRDLKRLLDSERRVSGGGGPEVEESTPSASSSSGYTDSSHGPTAGEMPMQRGIPMWIVVRTLKASWHADGSWPILAADEVYPTPASPKSRTSKDKGKAREMPSRPHKDIPRSVHPSEVILRPPGTTSFQVPLPPPDLMLPGAKMPKADPGMDEIARRYRTRGVAVEGAEKRLSILDEHSHGAEEDSEEAAERRSRTSSLHQQETDVGTSGRDEGEESAARVVVIPGAPQEGSDGHRADNEGDGDGDGGLASREGEQRSASTKVVVMPGSFQPDAQRYGEIEQAEGEGEGEADTTIGADPRTIAMLDDRTEPQQPLYQAQPQQAVSNETAQPPVHLADPPSRAPPPPPRPEGASAAQPPSRPPPPLPPVPVSVPVGDVVEAHMMYEPVAGAEPPAPLPTYFPDGHGAETKGAVQHDAPPPELEARTDSLPPPVASLPMESLLQR